LRALRKAEKQLEEYARKRQRLEAEIAKARSAIVSLDAENENINGQIARVPESDPAKKNRLITQMYFPDDTRNRDDVILGTAMSNRQLLVADVRPPTPDLEPDSLLAHWNIVLENG
jgi:septal ring factor EnvC (AmiA/AmiB activator)